MVSSCRDDVIEAGGTTYVSLPSKKYSSATRVSALGPSVLYLQVLSAQKTRPTEAEILTAVEEGDKTAGVFGNLF